MSAVNDICHGSREHLIPLLGCGVEPTEEFLVPWSPIHPSLCQASCLAPSSRPRPSSPHPLPLELSSSRFTLAATVHQG